MDTETNTAPEATPETGAANTAAPMQEGATEATPTEATPETPSEETSTDATAA